MLSIWHSKAEKIANKVLQRSAELDGKSQEDLIDMVKSIRENIINSSNIDKALDSNLVEAYAIAFVAAKRTLGLTPYKEQIMAGWCLHKGHIVQQDTGQGKTVTALFPAFLHALTGRGVHVVTVNPYLTLRDANNIGRAHKYLGLSVGAVTSEQSLTEKKLAYSRDVTYVSNTELGFDYLRDNMAVSSDRVVQRGLEYAIVDEVDSILIDEARTPLIIAGEGNDVSKLFRAVNNIVEKMEKGSESREFNRGEAYLGVEREEFGDYIVHEKKKNVILTEQGIKKVENGLGIKNYSDQNNRSIQHVVEKSLHAHALMQKGKEYIVKSGKIYLVDEFTGRIAEGRQYADGLHQAIEAKEHVEVSNVNETIGTTTYQNFFRKYRILSGMTGTAATERREFKSTYGLDVCVIEPHQKKIRIDLPDRLFLRKEDKWNAVKDEIVSSVKIGQPVLVGTASVEESEAMSKILNKANIKHQVLNAKQDAKEAELVSKAGIHGVVTVATNMAGRGTDIILDEEAKAAGGLYVIGTEKNESERIDNQLRGRAGRQGDPGKSVFYCSTEDRVIRLYGGDRFKKQLEGTELDDGGEIKVKAIMKAIKSTQKKVELDNFASRQNTLEYDDVNDGQRERIYKERRNILAKGDVQKQVEYCFAKAIEEIAAKTKDTKEFAIKFTEKTGLSVLVNLDENKKVAVDMAKKLVLEEISNDKYGSDEAKQSYVRRCLLVAIDSAWAEHLKALEFCREAVSYFGYGQQDPKSVYAHEAYKLYEKLQTNIYMAVLYVYFKQRDGFKTNIETEDGNLKIKSTHGMEV